ncbi:DNA-binding transcriptional regulator BolA-like isoform X2 [Dysidea avara]
MNNHARRWNHVRVQPSIEAKLRREFEPAHLLVQNESHMHNVPHHSETHFKVVVVSGCFNGLSLVKRHRLVNDCLKQELASGVHALSIEAHTPEQWTELEGETTQSPPCMGGGVTKPSSSL